MWIGCIVKIWWYGNLWDVDTSVLKRGLRRLLLYNSWAGSRRRANVVAGDHERRRRLLALHLHLLLLGLRLLLIRPWPAHVRSRICTRSSRLLAHWWLPWWPWNGLRVCFDALLVFLMQKFIEWPVHLLFLFFIRYVIVWRVWIRLQLLAWVPWRSPGQAWSLSDEVVPQVVLLRSIWNIFPRLNKPSVLLENLRKK